jgi:hypothetical protein
MGAAWKCGVITEAALEPSRRTTVFVKTAAKTQPRRSPFKTTNSFTFGNNVAELIGAYMTESVANLSNGRT